MMTEAQFNELFIKTIQHIEDSIDQCDAEIDSSFENEILTLEFSNGKKIIINKQTPTRQIWVATPQGGFHYDFRVSEQRWHDNKTQNVLFADLSRFASFHAQIQIVIEN